jgi:hypothetical protein
MRKDIAKELEEWAQNKDTPIFSNEKVSFK